MFFCCCTKIPFTKCELGQFSLVYVNRIVIDGK